jgi:chloride channel 3/4/5
MTIYLSASDTVISTKDIKGRQTVLCNDKAETEDEQEAPARLPRSQSVQSYGALEFGSRRRSARQYSVDSIASTPLLPNAAEEAGNPPATTAAPRKIMYFAAGSGIPEIKTLLSGFVIRGYLGGWTL